jgi:hypothetical protein
MMRPTSIGCSTCALVLAFALASPVLAQDKAQTKSAKPEAAKPAPKVLTLSGCVVRGETPPGQTGQYTIEDKEEGVTYRLTGTDVRDYIGRRVQVVGGVPSPRRFTIVGGLTPNANVAAQAGDMDPARAAVASAGGSAGPGTVQLPEFKVKSVRPASGGCPD